MKKILNIGLVQMHCSVDIGKNLKRAEAGIRRLAKKGAQIVGLPELFAREYFCQTENAKFFEYAESIPGPLTRALSETARKNKVAIVTSLYEKTPGAKAKTRYPKGFFNTAVVIGQNGTLAGKYRKMHIPDDLQNYYGERNYFEQGNFGFRAFKTPAANIAPLVCWDQWFPEAARVASCKGAQLIMYPTAIGFQKNDPLGLNETEREAWQIIQRSHAIANNVFVAAVNRVGDDGKIDFWGTSFICDPYGRVLAKAPPDREAELFAELDLSLIAKMRKDWPFLDARRVKCENHLY